MATTYTPIWRLAVLQPFDPATENSWGAIQDLTMPLMEQGAVGTITISIGGLASFSLTTANNASDQARYFRQDYTGALSADCVVTIPNVKRVGYARNSTTGGFNVRLTSGAGTIALVPGASGLSAASWYQWECDGAGNVALVILGAGIANLEVANIDDLTTTGLALAQGGVQFGTDPQFVAKRVGGTNAVGFASGIYIGYTATDLDINAGSGLAHILGGRSVTIGAYGYLTSNIVQTGYVAGGTTATYGLQVDNRVTASEFDAVSDARMKTDVTDIDAAEGERFVRSTRPVTFKKKGEWGAGFIAQEVLRAGFAGMVSAHDAPGLPAHTSDDGLISPPNTALAVTYNHAIAYLTAALRSALERIDALERRG